MGFLMGAYGKLMAGKHVRDLQIRMTSVQSQLRRITREISSQEKYYQAMERNIKQGMQAQMQISIMAAANAGGLPYSNDPSYFIEASKDNDFISKANAFSFTQQAIQQQYTQAQTMWQNQFEMQREADLQALKDIEDSLQLEKDNLESQIKIAQADYEANKDMEKQGAQNMKPDYTGQA